MKLKRQRGKYDCGIAVLSMITGKPFSECRELVGMTHVGCFTQDIQRALNFSGVPCLPDSKVTARCVLRLQGDEGSHFVLRWDGLTYDPAKGVSAQCPEPSEILRIL